MGFAQVLFGSQSRGRLFRGRSITRVGTGGTGRSLEQTCFSSSALEAQAYSRERGKKNISALWSAGLRPRIQRRELKQTPGRWLKRHKLNFHIEHWKTVLLHALEELFSFYIWQPCSSYQRREMTCFTVVCKDGITTVLSSFSIVKPLRPISFQDCKHKLNWNDRGMVTETRNFVFRRCSRWRGRGPCLSCQLSFFSTFCDRHKIYGKKMFNLVLLWPNNFVKWEILNSFLSIIVGASHSLAV